MCLWERTVSATPQFIIKHIEVVYMYTSIHCRIFYGLTLTTFDKKFILYTYISRHSYWEYQKLLTYTLTYILAMVPVLMLEEVTSPLLSWPCLDSESPQEKDSAVSKTIKWLRMEVEHQHRVCSKYVCECIHKKFLIFTVPLPNYVRI